MILAGDECRRTQCGNNNPYLQDNELSWFDWTLVEPNAALVDFVRFLVDFRRPHPALRREDFSEVSQASAGSATSSFMVAS
jgi:isoamylase